MDATTVRGTAVSKNASLTVDAHFDFVCPWCLVGKRNLDAAVSRLASLRPEVSVKVRWHSHQLLPDTPVGGLPYQAFYVARLGVQARSLHGAHRFRRPLTQRVSNWRSTGS